MDKKMLKSSKIACLVAMALWSMWAVIFVLRVLRFAGIINFEVGLGIDIAPVQWITDDPDIVPVQWVALLGYIFTTAAMLTMIFVFLYKSLKGISSDTVFNRANCRLLYAMAGLGFFYELFDTNRHIFLAAQRELVLTSDAIVLPLVIMVVSVFYKLALNAYEDSKLAI